MAPDTARTDRRAWRSPRRRPAGRSPCAGGRRAAARASPPWPAGHRPHRPSIRRSTETIEPASSASMADSARCFGPPRATRVSSETTSDGSEQMHVHVRFPDPPVAILRRTGVSEPVGSGRSIKCAHRGLRARAEARHAVSRRGGLGHLDVAGSEDPALDDERALMERRRVGVVAGVLHARSEPVERGRDLGSGPVRARSRGPTGRPAASAVPRDAGRGVEDRGQRTTVRRRPRGRRTDVHVAGFGHVPTMHRAGRGPVEAPLHRASTASRPAPARWRRKPPNGGPDGNQARARSSPTLALAAAALLPATQHATDAGGWTWS